MSLPPTNGIPTTTMPNLMAQGGSNLMSLGVASQNHPMMVSSGGSLLSGNGDAHLSISNNQMAGVGHPLHTIASSMSPGLMHVGMNGSIPATSTSHLPITDNNSAPLGNMSVMMPPYGNIQVKQEGGGVVPSTSVPPSLINRRHDQIQSPVQYPQLSSSDLAPVAAPQPGAGGNVFSVPPSNAATAAAAVSKHICAVCGDRASGKHYGVYSCEGCKGFFKRTVRKYLTYTCRDEKECVIDKRQRNRCQFCRYKKCLAMGMKKEAVQDERQKTREQEDAYAENSLADDMPVEKILEAELLSDPKPEEAIPDFEQMELEQGVQLAADHQLYTLVDWAKRVPHFTSLSVDDQVTLLRAGWNELLIASFSHRSINHPDAIVLSIGYRVYRQTAHSAGVGAIFDRVLSELISKMRSMNMDRTELGCLRAIVLFNPDAKDLNDGAVIESLREKVYASLEIYCRSKYPDQTGRFAKLLLRLPALRSIALKCLEHLFVFKLVGNQPINQFLLEKLEEQAHNSNNNQQHLQQRQNNNGGGGVQQNLSLTDLRS